MGIIENTLIFKLIENQVLSLYEVHKGRKLFLKSLEQERPTLTHVKTFLFDMSPWGEVRGQRVP